MNIVLIVVDTLRYDYIGAHGNRWIQTPNMDRLAAESWVYDHNYSASYPTIPHRTDVMTGRYGAPLHPWRPLRHDARSLPWMLAESGYCTQLIHDTPHLVNGGHNFDWPFHGWTFVRGAEVDRPWIDKLESSPPNWAPDPLFEFEARSVLDTDRVVATYARANRHRVELADWNTAQLFTTASRWLRENVGRDNAFLWVDCFDPHEPWDAPPEYMQLYDKTAGYDGRLDPLAFVLRNDERLSKAARDRVAASYAAKVSWVDHWLGMFLDTLDATRLAQNTAVILTADHGTNVGERGHFGKGYPVREQEAHTPLFIRVPQGGSGRSKIIVQPQDLFATILSIAGLLVPPELESFDVLSLAQRGEESHRDMALAGRSIDSWTGNPKEILFTVFDREWQLQVAAQPESCILTCLGRLDDVSSRFPNIVFELRIAGLDELARRGADPSLVAWARSGGGLPFPQEATYWTGWPGPAGFKPYFQRLYLHRD